MIVKICGITTVEDALAAFAAGADLIGVNLVAGPRLVDLERAFRIVEAIDDAERAVALLGTDDPARFDEEAPTLHALGVRRFQLYGDSTIERMRMLALAATRMLLPLCVEDRGSLDRYSENLATYDSDDVEFVLLDAAVKGKLGGTGKSADWDMLAAARAEGSLDEWPSIMLAGGLTPDNVRRAIQTVKPDAVDVSSGVESSPGRKDAAALEAFVTAARMALGR